MVDEKLKLIDMKLAKIQSEEGAKLRALADKAAIDAEKKSYVAEVAHAFYLYNEYNFIKFVDSLNEKQLNEYENALRVLREAGELRS